MQAVEASPPPFVHVVILFRLVVHLQRPRKHRELRTIKDRGSTDSPEPALSPQPCLPRRQTDTPYPAPGLKLPRALFGHRGQGTGPRSTWGVSFCQKGWESHPQIQLKHRKAQTPCDRAGTIPAVNATSVSGRGLQACWSPSGAAYETTSDKEATLAHLAGRILGTQSSCPGMWQPLGHHPSSQCEIV